jgi:hypothetical protein
VALCPRPHASLFAKPGNVIYLALLGYNGNPLLLEMIAYGVISSPSARPVGDRAERWFQLLKPALELLNVFPKMRLLS